MSVIRKKPFIETVLQDLTGEQLNTLTSYINGSGTATEMVLGNANFSELTGIHYLKLKIDNLRTIIGFYIRNENYAVFISYNGTSEKLIVSSFDPNTWFITDIEEHLTIEEIRREIYDIYDRETAAPVVTANVTLAGTENDLVSLQVGETKYKINTYRSYPSGWPTNGTTLEFLNAINADASAVVGISYLGKVTLSDLPASMTNAEIKVEVMSGTGTSNKVIHLVCTSGNRAPYRWEYTYWDNGSNISGWVPIGSGHIFTNVSASDWEADVTYSDYGYACVLACTGITSSSVVEVIFGAAEAVSGDYAPICESGTDTVTIYSKVNTAITIPTIKEIM